MGSFAGHAALKCSVFLQFFLHFLQALRTFGWWVVAEMRRLVAWRNRSPVVSTSVHSAFSHFEFCFAAQP